MTNTSTAANFEIYFEGAKSNKPDSLLHPTLNIKMNSQQHSTHLS